MKSGNDYGKAGKLSMKSLHSALRLRLTFAAQIGNDSGKAGELSIAEGFTINPANDIITFLL